MRIRSIEVNNFKSLVGFRLDLSKFSCLIGLNGVGKSTILQFIDFLGQQARGDIQGWLEKRNWKARELSSHLKSGTTVPLKRALTFRVEVVDQDQQNITWTGEFSPSRLQCTKETVTTADAELKVRSSHYSIMEHGQARDSGKILFTFEGSILSQLRKEVLPESLERFKKFLLSTESLDMLTPERLRQRTKVSNGSLGHGGRHLSAFVFELGKTGRLKLARRLREVYAQLDHVYAKSIQAGWKQLLVREEFGGAKLLTEATHVNDGTLRLLAILAELASNHEFLLFDEIENGINPELVEFVTDALVEAKQQVMVTTHSPMILNYLEDATAGKGVIYVYKTRLGHTQAIPFFSIPSLKKKLSVMGPGEAFVDTSLSNVDEEIAAMAREGV